MPVLLLAGYQRSVDAQLRKALRNYVAAEGWLVEPSPGDEKAECTISPGHSVRLAAEAARLQGAHVLAIADARCLVNCEALRERFRFRRSGAHFVGPLARGDEAPLSQLLDQVITEEDEWIGQVGVSLTSPLLLPKKVFDANREVASLWTLAEAFNDPPQLAAFSRISKRFVECHLREFDSDAYNRATPWLADDGWGWRDDGPRHGKPLDPRDEWKYSFKLPDGFHYDVSSARKGKRDFRDAKGAMHGQPKGYLNVTVHGFIRGE